MERVVTRPEGGTYENSPFCTRMGAPLGRWWLQQRLRVAPWSV